MSPAPRGASPIDVWIRWRTLSAEEAEGEQYVRAEPALVTEQPEQDVLGADVSAAQLGGLAFGNIDGLDGAVGEAGEHRPRVAQPKAVRRFGNAAWPLLCLRETAAVMDLQQKRFQPRSVREGGGLAWLRLSFGIASAVSLIAHDGSFVRCS